MQRMHALPRAYPSASFRRGGAHRSDPRTHHNDPLYLTLMRQIPEAIEFGNLVEIPSECGRANAAGQRNLKPAARWPSSENRTEIHVAVVARVQRLALRECECS